MKLWMEQRWSIRSACFTILVESFQRVKVGIELNLALFLSGRYPRLQLRVLRILTKPEADGIYVALFLPRNQDVGLS